MAKLTDSQRKSLDEYLLDKKTIINSSPTLNMSEVAAWCRDAMKFDVDVTNVNHRVGPKGALYEHQWPGTESGIKGRAGSKATINFLIQQLESDRRVMQMLLGRYNILVNELGATHVLMPSKLPTLPGFDEIVAQAGSELADCDLRSDEEK